MLSAVAFVPMDVEGAFVTTELEMEIVLMIFVDNVELELNVVVSAPAPVLDPDSSLVVPAVTPLLVATTGLNPPPNPGKLNVAPIPGKPAPVPRAALAHCSSASSSISSKICSSSPQDDSMQGTREEIWQRFVVSGFVAVTVTVWKQVLEEKSGSPEEGEVKKARHGRAQPVVD